MGYDIVIALAGNPNTGKSTIFNTLTGLKQHTGNWPGKTVTNAQGIYKFNGKKFILVDLPGTYSLFANSVEEEVARDFICFGNPDATIVVLDATCLERNLNLALQILEITSKVVVCVNLIDEAKRKGINLDLVRLSEELGVPVIGTNAREGIGLEELQAAVYKIAAGEIPINPIRLTYNEELENKLASIETSIKYHSDSNVNTRWLALYEITVQDSARFTEEIVETIINQCANIASKTVSYTSTQYNMFDRKIDNILTSRTFGIPIMLVLLGFIFWLTVEGANYPSELLAFCFNHLEKLLTHIFVILQAPDWLYGITVLGIYRTLAWVVSVMLPPMAIFFPLFTLMEDLGYLPRIAFNLDNYFKKACAHGKQVLTMCMGFGCNAAGIISCRIIDSPRERLIAMITNNFVPCNGRFPTLIAIASIFIANNSLINPGIISALCVLMIVVLGVFITLFISKLLSKTLLKGLPSSFTLELPPYRKPQIGRIIIRSIFDRTLFVLSRAVCVAAPTGAIIWLLANINLNGSSMLSCFASLLDPFAYLLGLDGFILMSFILGLPANEIVIPILIMSYMSEGAIFELNSLDAMRELFIANGWTWLTAVCTMLFVLNHWPCATTLLTIRKETQSLKWTFISFLIPTITGIVLCFIVAQSARLLGFV